jgi:hypothetical protein
LGERLNGIQEVVGSIPIGSTKQSPANLAVLGPGNSAAFFEAWRAVFANAWSKQLAGCALGDAKLVCNARADGFLSRDLKTVGVQHLLALVCRQHLGRRRGSTAHLEIEFTPIGLR